MANSRMTGRQVLRVSHAWITGFVLAASALAGCGSAVSLVSSSGTVDLSWSATHWGQPGSAPMTYHGTIGNKIFSGTMVAHVRSPLGGCPAKFSSSGSLGPNTFVASGVQKCATPPIAISGRLGGETFSGTADPNGGCGSDGTCYYVTIGGQLDGQQVTSTLTLTQNESHECPSDQRQQYPCVVGTLKGTYHLG